MAPTWEKPMKDVDLDEPTTFLDQVYLECTQRDCELNEDFVEQYKTIFETESAICAQQMLP